MPQTRRTPLVALAALSFVALKGDGCGGPGATATCSGKDANIVLRPGYCAAVPNCAEGTPTYGTQYSLSTLDSMPAWMSLIATLLGHLDTDPSTPADAFRVCADRLPTASEPSSTSFTLDITKPAQPAFLAQKQKVNVAVRDSVPTVSINVVRDPTKVRITSTATGTGTMRGTALAGGKFRVQLLALNSDASSCTDLTWVASRGTITCDAMNPFEAVVDLSGVEAGADLEISLSVKEKSDGYISYSNHIVVRTEMEDPTARGLEIVGPVSVSGYSRVQYTASCWVGLWDRHPCGLTLSRWDWQIGGEPVSNAGPTTMIMVAPRGQPTVEVSVVAVDSGGAVWAGSVWVRIQ